VFDFIGKICLVVALFAAGATIGFDGIKEFFTGIF